MAERAKKRYVVVALFDAIDVATFSRRRWPAHVTLVSNFATAAPVEEIAAAVHRAGALAAPTRLEFAGLDLFGPKRDVPVRLVVPGRVAQLHRDLIDELASIIDIAADESAYWGEGYRPHLTLTPSIEVAEGEIRVVRDIAIARLDGPMATVVAALRTQSE